MQQAEFEALRYEADVAEGCEGIGMSGDERLEACVRGLTLSVLGSHANVDLYVSNVRVDDALMTR